MTQSDGIGCGCLTWGPHTPIGSVEECQGVRDPRCIKLSKTNSNSLHINLCFTNKIKLVYIFKNIILERGYVTFTVKGVCGQKRLRTPGRESLNTLAKNMLINITTEMNIIIIRSKEI